MFDYNNLQYNEEGIALIPAAHPDLAGWTWKHYDDAEGVIVGPNDEQCFDYDLCPYYGQKVEYRDITDGHWSVYDGGIEDFVAWAEDRLARTLAK